VYPIRLRKKKLSKKKEGLERRSILTHQIDKEEEAYASMRSIAR
jgi:hypothetical protein